MFNAVVRIIWINVVGFSMMRNTTKPPLSEPWGSFIKICIFEFGETHTKVKDGEFSQSVHEVNQSLIVIEKCFQRIEYMHFSLWETAAVRPACFLPSLSFIPPLRALEHFLQL